MIGASNNGLEQTGRGGVAVRLRRPVVEARPAGEAGCWADVCFASERNRQLCSSPLASSNLFAFQQRVEADEREGLAIRSAWPVFRVVLRSTTQCRRHRS
jgi:hypothetical protein